MNRVENPVLGGRGINRVKTRYWVEGNPAEAGYWVPETESRLWTVSRYEAVRQTGFLP